MERTKCKEVLGKISVSLAANNGLYKFVPLKALCFMHKLKPFKIICKTAVVFIYGS